MYTEGEISMSVVQEEEKIGKAECGADSPRILYAGIKTMDIFAIRILFSAVSSTDLKLKWLKQ